MLKKLLERDDVQAGKLSPYSGDFGGGLSPAKGEHPRTPSTTLPQLGIYARTCLYRYVIYHSLHE